MIVGRLVAPARAGARSWRRLSRADRWAIAVLIVLPVLIYVPFSLAGRPLMPGDGLFQNYPLRVLTGEVIRSGHLPAWDPLIWSGTPLLAGWNAGSMFPGTWLFAVFPGIAAWTLNLLISPICGALGVYVLCRQLRCRPLASLLAGLVFAYTGFSIGQSVHLGLVQGTAFIPWLLIGIEGAAGSRTTGRQFGFALLIAVSLALIVLAGDPRSITSGVIAGAVLAVARSLGKLRQAIRLLVVVIAGGALGLALSAIQWVPGLGFLHASQRGVTAYSFYSAGSLHLNEIGAYLLLPDLFGGNGNFGEPVFQGNFNLPEISFGVGFVALVAVCAYLPLLARRMLDRLLRRGVSQERHPLGAWYALIVLGLLLTLGTTTPLGHLFVHVPLFGGERLQNRNALLMDLGLAVLVGYFVDDLITPSEVPTDRRPLASLASRALATAPALATLAVVAYGYVAPSSLEHSLLAATASSRLLSAMGGYLVASCVLVVLLTVFTMVVWHLKPRTRRTLIALFCLADVAMFLAFASWNGTPSSRLGPSTLSAEVTELLGPNGRFAFFNPNYYAPRIGNNASQQIGATDLNILEHNPSVQGYGSIVDGTYQSVTATHAFENLDISRLDGESFNTLDLRAFLTLPAYLAQPLAIGAPVPQPRPSATAGSSGGPWSVGLDDSDEFLLPGRTQLTGLTVDFAGTAAQPAAVRLTTRLAGTPARSVTVPVVGGAARFAPARAVTADSVTVAVPSVRRALIEVVVADTTAPAKRLVLNGALQGEMRTPHWRPTAPIGPFLVYVNTEARGFAWLQSVHNTTPNTRHLAPGTVRITSDAPPDAQVMVVSTPKTAALVRSETFSPGWSAQLTPIGGGATKSVGVGRFGLVQRITVPRGTWRVTWRYAPPALTAGLVATIAAFVALVLGLVVLARWRWRQRRPGNGDAVSVRGKLAGDAETPSVVLQ